jgi:hypothetical protein
MRHPQIVIHELDGRLASQLRPLAEAQRWALREPRQLDPLLSALATGGPAVLVLRIGRDLERELGLLDTVAWRFPETRVVVVGGSEQASVAPLAWDLGAAYVGCPAPPADQLAELVAALMPLPPATTPRRP